MAQEKDMVNNPPHYAEGTSLECIDAMIIALGIKVVMYFCLGNAFKYLWRHKLKGGMQDLDKTEWYLNKYLELDSNRGREEDNAYRRLCIMSGKYRKKLERELKNVTSED